MAKELPYFKFEPGEWENGNIQMLSRDQKGLFIDLCSMYWSRLGDVPFKLAMRKLCDGNATALNSLLEEGIIKVENDYLRIDFLELQLSEFNQVSNQNSKNAKEGWEKRRRDKALSERNATASIPQCENDAIREEKKKEEEIIKEKINNIVDRKLKFASTLEPFISIYGKDFLNDFYKYWTEPNKTNSKFKQELEKTWSLERRLETWAKNDKNFNKQQNQKTNEQKIGRMSIDTAIKNASGWADIDV